MRGTSISGFLIDNNVPRGVTHLIRDRGFDAVEVRAALAHDAPDSAVVAYAGAQGLVLITHDRGCAHLAERQGVPHVWLRTPETADRDRIAEVLEDVVAAFSTHATRIAVFRTRIRRD